MFHREWNRRVHTHGDTSRKERLLQADIKPQGTARRNNPRACLSPTPREQDYKTGYSAKLQR